MKFGMGRPYTPRRSERRPRVRGVPLQIDESSRRAGVTRFNIYPMNTEGERIVAEYGDQFIPRLR